MFETYREDRMPLNYLELQTQLRDYAQKAAAARKSSEKDLEQLQQWLKACAAIPQEELRMRCQEQSSARCALPAGETIDETFPADSSPAACLLLAADGSQIVPSAHDAVPLALINVGLIAWNTANTQAPEVSTRSAILEQFAQGTELDLISEDLVRLKRDVVELVVLADYAPQASLPVIALRDGPLELYHEPRQSQQFEGEFSRYTQLLKQLARRGFSLAGYIDRSQSTTITQMLHIYHNRKEAEHILPDVRLMELLLPPASRSAIFELQSTSSRFYTGELRVHFFYLNVGSEATPYIVRVEIPAWVAFDSADVNRLQATLLEQCRMLGSRPYPYILHRAHETAVVTFEEKEHLQEALQVELRRNGVDTFQISNKLAAKELSNRTRM
jgi:hypothetical protein